MLYEIFQKFKFLWLLITTFTLITITSEGAPICPPGEEVAYGMIGYHRFTDNGKECMSIHWAVYCDNYYSATVTSTHCGPGIMHDDPPFEEPENVVLISLEDVDVPDLAEDMLNNPTEWSSFWDFVYQKTGWMYSY